jgi:hypothetical protein
MRRRSGTQLGQAVFQQLAVKILGDSASVLDRRGSFGCVQADVECLCSRTDRAMRASCLARSALGANRDLVATEEMPQLEDQ